MRWYILRTLLVKEALRHKANRGGLVLALLLVVAALLVSVFGRPTAQGGGLLGGVQHCFVDYGADGPWVEHLRQNFPEELRGHIRFRPLARAAGANGQIVYPAGAGAIQIRPLEAGADGRPRFKIWFWHPGSDATGLAPYEAWFWRETRRYFEAETAAALAQVSPAARPAELEPEWSALSGGLDSRSAISTSLVLFAVFFVCVYLLPSLTCEERERGVLLAQALSPASPFEILAAKFVFYPAFGLGLAVLLAGLATPAVLARPFFWLALVVLVFGSLGIGLTIASVARTQREASMGALCYMMVVAMLLFICQQANIPGLPHLALEYHGPRMLHAALTGRVHWFHWGNLAAAAALSVAWAALATRLFRQRGWQ